MNVVVVLIDSLNRHALSAYGPSPVATPNLDAFAGRAWRLDNHFVGSLPCMPARREIFAGFKEMMWRPWGPLEPFDHRLPKLLADHGHATGIVTDHYHYWEPLGNEYVQSFRSAEFIRGHESDFWKLPVPAGEPVPGWVGTELGLSPAGGHAKPGGNAPRCRVQDHAGRKGSPVRT
ncbi:MAG: sulfatase-like hydrolase/transferase, partial [Thermomicrobiales bacterium]